jgi:hypothetical protein
MGRITYITNSRTDITVTSGYCLVEMKAVYLTHPTDVMGSLFTCPCCGVLDTKDRCDYHVFNPSAPLITVLDRRE